MATKKTDILNLEWLGDGRDPNIVEPVLLYLESEGFTVSRGCIFDYQEIIKKVKPRAIVISNTIGDKINFDMIKYANSLGIYTISLISEGDYPDNSQALNFIWGWNKKKHYIEDLHLEWSTKNINLIKKYAKVDTKKIFVSGATGFDRYKLLNFESKDEFLKKNGLEKFKKVIGYAGWGFDLMDPEGIYYSNYNDMIDSNYNDIHLKEYTDSRQKINEILKKLIKNNPDTLFILKHHPGEVEEARTEFYGIESQENVYNIKGSQMGVSDVINICDLWMAFESTTCLEAWLLGKESMLLRPLELTYPESMISRGSLKFCDYEEIQNILNHLGDNSILHDEDILRVRKQIIKNLIEYDDGLNHVRAGEYVRQFLELNKEKKKKIDSAYIYSKSMYFMDKIFYLPIIKRIPGIRKYVNYMNKLRQGYVLEERMVLSERYKEAQSLFYKEKTGKINSIKENIENEYKGKMHEN